MYLDLSANSVDGKRHEMECLPRFCLKGEGREASPTEGK